MPSITQISQALETKYNVPKKVCERVEVLFYEYGKQCVEDYKEKQKIINYEWLPENWRELFNIWLTYKKEKRSAYRSEKTVKIAFMQLVEMSNDNIHEATQIIKFSMGNNYQGLFKPKQDNGQSNKTTAEQFNRAATDLINRLSKQS